MDLWATGIKQQSYDKAGWRRVSMPKHVKVGPGAQGGQELKDDMSRLSKEVQ
jgi:hypothetical protein